MELCLLLLLLPAVLIASPIGSYGAAAGDTGFGDCGDCVTTAVPVVNLTIWGLNASTLQVNENGVITVDAGYTGGGPGGNLPFGSLPIFSPFWVWQSVNFTCVLEAPDCPGFFYRHSQDPLDIDDFTPILSGVAPAFTPDNMFVATWITVALDALVPEDFNTYQAVILWDAITHESWVVYNYESLEFGGIYGFGPAAGIQGNGVGQPQELLPFNGDANSHMEYLKTATCGAPPGQYFSRLDVVVNWDVCYCEREDSLSCDFAGPPDCSAENNCGGHGECQFMLGGGGAANCTDCKYGWDFYPNNCSNWVTCGDCGNPAAVVSCDESTGCVCQDWVFLDHEGRCVSGIGLFGVGEGDMAFPLLDDVAVGPNDLSGMGLTIFGTEVMDMYFSDNGAFAFESDGEIYMPATGQMLPRDAFIIAPFWDDVDPDLVCPLHMPPSCNKMLARMEINPAKLDTFTDQFLPAQKAGFTPDGAVVATYDHVMGTAPGHNFFQAVMLADSVSKETWLLLNYDKMEWGSSNAIVGVGGVDMYGFNLPWGNSAEAATRLPTHATCGSRAGRYVIRIDVWPPEHAGFCGCDDAEDEDCTLDCVDDFDCHSHGTCNAGVCDCDWGWHMAPYCNYFTPNCTDLSDCSGHGDCVSVPPFSTNPVEHVCDCDMDYGSLADCSTFVPCEEFSYCSGHGTCYDDDFCLCDFGYQWDSPSCDVFTPDCNHLANCSAHGTCVSSPALSTDIADHSCNCDTDFDSVADCSVEIPCSLFGECNGHGTCVAGACECEFGYRSTTSCDTFAADCTDLSDCSSHGTCEVIVADSQNPTYHVCDCEEGWEIEDDCSVTPDCSELNDCSGHGTCLVGADDVTYCMCDAGWAKYDDCDAFSFAGMSAAEVTATAAVLGGFGLVCLAVITVGIVLLVLFLVARRGVAVSPGAAPAPAKTQPDRKLKEFNIAEPKKEVTTTRVVVAAPKAKQVVEEEVVVADVSDSSSSSSSDSDEKDEDSDKGSDEGSDSSDKEEEPEVKEVEAPVVIQEEEAPVVVVAPPVVPEVVPEVVVAPPEPESGSDSDKSDDSGSDSDKSDSDKEDEDADSDKGSDSDKDEDSDKSDDKSSDSDDD